MIEIATYCISEISTKEHSIQPSLFFGVVLGCEQRQWLWEAAGVAITVPYQVFCAGDGRYYGVWAGFMIAYDLRSFRPPDL
jgi:hypothetical protein